MCYADTVTEANHVDLGIMAVITIVLTTINITMHTRSECTCITLWCTVLIMLYRLLPPTRTTSNHPYIVHASSLRDHLILFLSILSRLRVLLPRFSSVRSISCFSLSHVAYPICGPEQHGTFKDFGTQIEDEYDIFIMLFEISVMLFEV